MADAQEVVPEGEDGLGRLLASMQRDHPNSRILILDLPRDTVLRAVRTAPVEGKPLVVGLTITLESVDSEAMHGIAKRLTVTAEMSEAAMAARKAEADAK